MQTRTRNIWRFLGCARRDQRPRTTLPSCLLPVCICGKQLCMWERIMHQLCMWATIMYNCVRGKQLCMWEKIMYNCVSRSTLPSCFLPLCICVGKNCVCFQKKKMDSRPTVSKHSCIVFIVDGCLQKKKMCMCLELCMCLEKKMDA